MEHNFTVGCKVNTEYGEGVVWKISDEAVHVKHTKPDNFGGTSVTFSKYIFAPYHHTQSPITDIRLIK
jgi:hypothetical protein